MTPGSPVSEHEYREIAAACDRVLRWPDAPLEWIALPWLHVLNQHPAILERYAGAVAELRAVATGSVAPAGGSGVGVSALLPTARSIWRAPWARQAQRRGDVDVLFVSWLAHPDHLDLEHDFYYGDLPERLASRGLRSLIVLRNQTGTPTRRLRPRAERSGVIARTLLPDVLDIRTEAALFRGILRARAKLRKVARTVLAPLDRIVLGQAMHYLVPEVVAESLRLHCVVRDLCATVHPAALVTLYEGHAWEKVAAHAASQGGALRVAYQQTIMWAASHAIRRTVRPGEPFDPELVLTPGDITREWLTASPQLRPAPRILTLGSYRRPLGETLAVAPRPIGSVLVLPDGIRSESLLLFAFAIDCARRLSSVRFTLRSHPLLPYAVVASLLDPLPANVEVSTRTSLDHDLENAGALLYRGSSTVVGAVLRGLRPFYLAQDGEMSIDPLFEVDRWPIRVAEPDTFVARYLEDMARHTSERARDWAAAREYCDRYLVPVREETVDELVGAIRRRQVAS